MACRYSLSELFNIGRQLGRKTWCRGLDWNRLHELNIAKPFRGLRGGIYKQRHIQTVVTARFGLKSHGGGGVNKNNTTVLTETTTDKYSFPIPLVSSAVKLACLKSQREKNIINVQVETPPKRLLKVTSLNARSVKNKADDIADLICENEIDILKHGSVPQMVIEYP